MSLHSSAKAKTNYELWEGASQALADGKSFAHGDKIYTQADGPWIIEQMNYWARIYNQTKETEAGRSRHGFSVASFK